MPCLLRPPGLSATARRPVGWALLCAAVLLGAPTRAQTAETDDANVASLLASRHLHPHFAVLMSSLQWASTETGFMWTPFVHSKDLATESGFDFRLEIGTGGVKAKAGVGHHVGMIAHGVGPIIATLDASMLWTEWNPHVAPRHQRYLGVALDICFVALRFQFEMYAPMARADPTPKGLFVFSVGLGV